jgi:hypothetical protein
MTTKGWPESGKAGSRVEQVDKVHPDSSVMEGDPLAELACSLGMTSMSVCCKQARSSFALEDLSLVKENNVPPSSKG